MIWCMKCSNVCYHDKHLKHNVFSLPQVEKEREDNPYAEEELPTGFDDSYDEGKV